MGKYEISIILSNFGCLQIVYDWTDRQKISINLQENNI